MKYIDPDTSADLALTLAGGLGLVGFILTVIALLS